MDISLLSVRFFFFNDTATTEIYTLSLHDALPISAVNLVGVDPDLWMLRQYCGDIVEVLLAQDRKSTRLNSSHQIISYAVFCLKKKKQAPALFESDPPQSIGPRPSCMVAKADSEHL